MNRQGRKQKNEAVLKHVASRDVSEDWQGTDLKPALEVGWVDIHMKL